MVSCEGYIDRPFSLRSTSPDYIQWNQVVPISQVVLKAGFTGVECKLDPGLYMGVMSLGEASSCKYVAYTPE